MEFISKNLEETKKIAENYVANLPESGEKATVIGLYGDLGSGKTTFMKYFARACGVEENIQSPTFVIMKIFDLKNQKFDHLIHIDAYRLESPEELNKLGFQTMISDPKNLICIEWPERVAEIMPQHFMLRFEHAEAEGERKIQGEISFT